MANEISKRNLESNNAGSLWPAYTLFTSTVLLLAAWLIGPRLVEEYNFAATRGKVRAEYESAVRLLEDQPLEKVSKAFQLVATRSVLVSSALTRSRKLVAVAPEAN